MDDTSSNGPGPIPPAEPSLPSASSTEPPLFASPAVERVPSGPPPMASTPAGPVEPPLYVPPEPPLYVPPEPPLYVPPAPPVAWPAAASADAATSAGPEPPVRWEAPRDGDGIPVLGAPGLVYAGTGARLVAYLLDGLLLSFLIVPLTIIAAGALGGSTLGTAVATTAATVLDLSYFVLLWTGRRRATFGMRLLRLQIGSAADGRTITGEQAVKRWLGYGQWLSLLGITSALASLTSLLILIWAVVLLISVALDSFHEGLHDKLAGSAIVQTRGSSNALVVGCLPIIGFLVLIMFVSIVALVFLGSQISGLQPTQ